MRYALVLLLGALVGGALVYFLLANALYARKLPDLPPPHLDEGEDSTVAHITFDERFFNSALETIFKEIGAPTFRLAANGSAPQLIGVQDSACPSQITIMPEGTNTRTFVRLTDGKIAVPLAFVGNYNVFGRCLNFRGSAQTDFQLRFDPTRQILYGQLNVEGVSPEGISPAFAGLITLLVQRALNERVNPIAILHGEQLALDLPVQAAGGSLRARVKDIRAETGDGTLRLNIVYDFNGHRSPVK
ncbi:hypothetical protein [Pyrinomonas methylaliphatogenes]|jgi:hypothetical protein|uniref:DUF4403 family protein n=1 Tax=Pyrinomonas methylaliphatogenes TaxID=454194 RepID=A0A0B6WZS4_9BACT|nr:hypothetical protein [Pyrinomonas methylaliphatogenes]MBX5477443.1 hypothetical protein [Pyrinomonas methylaliphatogenes]CDM65809.1 hypothetical protein PYK22_01816 [Pyrinomonas methylaliphatogenes]